MELDELCLGDRRAGVAAGQQGGSSRRIFVALGYVLWSRLISSQCESSDHIHALRCATLRR